LTLSLIALAVFLSALLGAAVLLWRRLPGAAAASAGEVACVRCGTPGRLLAADSFLCPACRHDVRDLGVALARPGAAAGPLWRVVGFSAALGVVALAGTAIGVQAMPRTQYVAAEASFWQSGKGYRLVMFAVNGRRIMRGAERGPLEGELTADLFLTNGEVLTLEVQSPSRRYRVIDTAGREVVPLSADGAFNESAVLQWTAAVPEPDPFNKDGPPLARKAYAKIYEMLGPELPPPSPAPPAPPVVEAETLSTGSSSSHGGSGPPAYALPAAVMGWSLIWLSGLCFILRRSQRERAPAPAGQGAPA